MLFTRSCSFSQTDHVVFAKEKLSALAGLAQRQQQSPYQPEGILVDTNIMLLGLVCRAGPKLPPHSQHSIWEVAGGEVPLAQ